MTTRLRHKQILAKFHLLLISIVGCALLCQSNLYDAHATATPKEPSLAKMADYFTELEMERPIYDKLSDAQRQKKRDEIYNKKLKSPQLRGNYISATKNLDPSKMGTATLTSDKYVPGKNNGFRAKAPKTVKTITPPPPAPLPLDNSARDDKALAAQNGLQMHDDLKTFCVTCHNSESPTYKGAPDVAAMWDKIKHPIPAEAK